MKPEDYLPAPVIHRYPEPVLTSKDVPYESSLTFNAGVVHNGKDFLMLFRNDYGCNQYEWEHGRRFKGTNIGLATSSDGIRWSVRDKPAFALKSAEFERAYDPRITFLNGRYYICFAADTKHGVCGGICVTDDFERYDILSVSTPDNRNMTLFPEKINGNYIRLERPMPVYSRRSPEEMSQAGIVGSERFDIWLSESPDMVYWGKSRLVLGCEDVPYCNSKIGPGAPPLKTSKGWLAIFHAVDNDPARRKNGWEEVWQKRYVIGIMLLDLNDPSKVIGMSKQPLMVPEGPMETSGGFRNNALFPCGMLRNGDDEIRIYYSAGDAVVCMAYAKESDLLNLCGEAR